MGDGARYDRDKVRRMNKKRGGVGKDWTRDKMGQGGTLDKVEHGTSWDTGQSGTRDKMKDGKKLDTGQGGTRDKTGHGTGWDTG
jgi:hypothetical protein